MFSRIARAVASVTQTPTRIPSLDGLRCISIALVLFAHTSGTQHFPSFVYLRRNLGNFGVRVFFIISGFLITSLLLKELRQRGGISLKNFYIRRVFRIFPAAYFYLLVMAALTFAGWTDLQTNDLVHGVTYTTNYDRVRPWLTIHLWSLSVEEQFYLLWPATLVLAGLHRGMSIAAAVLLVAPLLRWLTPLLVPDWAWMVGMSFQTNADALATGCLLAGWRERLWATPLYRRLIESRLSYLAWAVALVMTVGFWAEGFWMQVFGQTVLNLCTAVLIDRAVRFPGGLVGGVLNCKPFVFVGVLSYSLYLWQQPLLNRLSLAWFNAFPVNLALVFVCSLLSYLCVERPFLELRKRFEPGAQAQRSRLAAQE